MLVTLDFQSFSDYYYVLNVDQINRRIRETIAQNLPPVPYQLFKAFSSTNQLGVADKFLDIGWRSWEDNADMDFEICKDTRSDCGQAPEDTTFVLITRGGDFLDLIRDLREQGTEVYLMTLHGVFIWPLSDQFSPELIREVGDTHWIKLEI